MAVAVAVAVTVTVTVAVALVNCIRDVPGLNFGCIVGFCILGWLVSEFEPTSGRTSIVQSLLFPFTFFSIPHLPFSAR